MLEEEEHNSLKCHYGESFSDGLRKIFRKRMVMVFKASYLIDYYLPIPLISPRNSPFRLSDEVMLI